MNNSETKERVRNGYRMEKPHNCRLKCPDKYYEMMLKCWNESPDERPTFAVLYKFFDDYVPAADGLYGESQTPGLQATVDGGRDPEDDQ
jgi:Protein tyrosine and serine/threonine kinase